MKRIKINVVIKSFVFLIGAFCCLLFYSSNYPFTPKKDNNWQEKLPNCPCKRPDSLNVVINDGWAKDIGDLEKYHPGAAICYRSYPPRQTTVGLSGQQCCYDENGYLIIDGAGAGTPDKASTCSGENKEGEMTLLITGVFRHYLKDVRPWHKLGWKEYNLLWPPNNGNQCSHRNLQEH